MLGQEWEPKNFLKICNIAGGPAHWEVMAIWLATCKQLADYTW